MPPLKRLDNIEGMSQVEYIRSHIETSVSILQTSLSDTGFVNISNHHVDEHDVTDYYWNVDRPHYSIWAVNGNVDTVFGENDFGIYERFEDGSFSLNSTPDPLRQRYELIGEPDQGVALYEYIRIDGTSESIPFIRVVREPALGEDGRLVFRYVRLEASSNGSFNNRSLKAISESNALLLLRSDPPDVDFQDYLSATLDPTVAYPELRTGGEQDEIVRLSKYPPHLAELNVLRPLIRVDRFVVSRDPMREAVVERDSSQPDNYILFETQDNKTVSMHDVVIVASSNQFEVIEGNKYRVRTDSRVTIDGQTRIVQGEVVFVFMAHQRGNKYIGTVEQLVEELTVSSDGSTFVAMPAVMRGIVRHS